MTGLAAAGGGLMLGTMAGKAGAAKIDAATQQAAMNSAATWWQQYLEQATSGNAALAEIARAGAIEQWKHAGLSDEDIRQREESAQAMLDMVAQQKETTAKIEELTDAINNRPIVVTAEIDGKAITEEITIMQAAFERSWGK